MDYLFIDGWLIEQRNLFIGRPKLAVVVYKILERNKRLTVVK